MADTIVPTALPAAAIDPADVQAVLPGLTIEQATLAAQLATAAVQAVLWPNTIPDPPPPPVYAVLLAAAVRFGRALEQGAALPVVSESIGSYSYRLATPATMDGAFGLTDAELAALDPWTARSGACTLDTWPRPAWPWPTDWWQRNLETPPDGPL